MKKLISLILILVSFSNVALADCDFSTGITRNDNGSYTYSRDCHIKVGSMKLDLEAANKQLTEYNKVIELKDLALSKGNERSDLWMNTSFKLQDRMNAIDDLKGKNQLLMFFAGVAITSLAVWGAGNLAHH